MKTNTPRECVSPLCDTAPGTTIPFDIVDSPGAYVCNWSGHLLRVPEEAVSPGHTPTIHMVGSAPLTVTKLCNNPHVPLRQAKRLADELHITTCF
ncbi:MAG: hypothetical protein ABIG44_05745 [Planctomycetota bacterium]